MQRLRRPFVQTLAALSTLATAAACGPSSETGRNPPAMTATIPPPAPSTMAGDDAGASARRAPVASGTPVPSAPSLADYPKTLNSVDAQGRSIFRNVADTCYVEMPWPAQMPRPPGAPPPQASAACPPEMKLPAWETCRGGAIMAKADRSECICFLMGNPPPPPQPNACPDASKPSAPPRLRATAGLKMEGDLDDKKLVAEANKQIEAVSKCAPIVRKTDGVVGSLNLQVTIAKDGKVTPDLKSPVNPDAKKCILEAVKAWSVKGAGAGKAMVLLSIE